MYNGSSYWFEMMTIGDTVWHKCMFLRGHTAQVPSRLNLDSLFYNGAVVSNKQSLLSIAIFNDTLLGL